MKARWSTLQDDDMEAHTDRCSAAEKEMDENGTYTDKDECPVYL